MEFRDTTEQLGDDTEPPGCPYQVLLADQQTRLSLDPAPLIKAVRSILEESTFQSAEVSVAVVDDTTIHKLNRQYLNHDYPTDVLSFVLEEDGSRLQGQLIVSVDTAATNAAEYGWSTENELLLYVVHGTLHLVGYRDKQPEEIASMRAAEADYLQRLCVEIPESHQPLAEDSR